MPGTPCVFYTHYLTYPKEIKAMIDARKLAGVTNTSSYQTIAILLAIVRMLLQVRMVNSWSLWVTMLTKLIVPTSRYTKLLSGYHYAYI